MSKSRITVRRALVLLAALAVIGAFTAWLTNIHKPLRADVPWFKWAAEATLKTGLPILDGKEATTGSMYHPPLLHYVGAAALAILGGSNWAFRALGMLAAVVALLGLMSMARRIGRPGTVSVAAVLGFGAYPILLGGSVPDHDGVILLPVVVAWAYLKARAFREGRNIGFWTAVAIAFALCWGKLTTSPLLLAGAVLADLWLLGWRAALRSAAAIALGFVFFAASWMGYAIWAQFNPLSFIEFAALGKVSVAAPWGKRLETLWLALLLIGLPTLALLGSRLRHEAESWRRQAAIWCVVVAIPSILAYTVLSPYISPFPLTWKYLIPGQALLLAAAAITWPGVPEGTSKRFLVAVLSLLVVLALVIGFQPGFKLGQYTGIALGLAALIALVGPKEGLRTARLEFGLLCASALLAAFIHIEFSRMGAGSPPELPNEEAGLADVGRELRNPRYEGKTFLCRRDVVLFVPGRRAHLIDPNFSRGTGPLDVPPEMRPMGPWIKAHWPFKVRSWDIDMSWERVFVDDLPGFLAALDQCDYVIDSKYDSYLRRSELKAAVAESFKVESEIGHYVFYKRSSPAPARSKRSSAAAQP